MKHTWRYVVLALLATAVVATVAVAQEVSFKDPVGDDNGPGTYSYPTDAVYKPGSFDLTSFKMKKAGDKYQLDFGVGATLEDKCWSMQYGFCVQMLFVFVKSDPATGHTEGLPGLNVQFAPEAGWNKVIIVSPQPANRVKDEAAAKVAKGLLGDVIVPIRVKGTGRTISAWIDAKDLPQGDIAAWGYQVIVQSNEGFPAATDLLTRKVNEYEGQHRFGGGNDGDCDPHAIDILAGDSVGDKSEIEAQHTMLAYECNADGTSKKMATLTMVHMKK
jgi:carbohydrate-binding DOMON domain-containing protein